MIVEEEIGMVQTESAVVEGEVAEEELLAVAVVASETEPQLASTRVAAASATDDGEWSPLDFGLDFA